MENYNLFIKETLSKLTDVPADSIFDHLHLREDLKIDSLSSIELISMIEEEFEISIDEEKVFNFTSVGDLIDYMNKEYKK
jgi:acyl carrier protein